MLITSTHDNRKKLKIKFKINPFERTKYFALCAVAAISGDI